MTQRYRVNVERSSDWWNLAFPEVEFVYAQTRRLDRVEVSARRALSLKLAVPEDSFGLDIHVILPPAVQQATQEVRRRRAIAEEAQEYASASTLDLLQSLAAQGYTVRDAGEIVGLSPQRVSQLSGRSASRYAPGPRDK